MTDIVCAAPPATVGETYTWTATIVDPVTNVAPSPDLSTYAAGDFEVRSAPGGPILLQATTSTGQMSFGAFGTGQYTVTFLAASITTAGTYTWEAKFTDTSGNVSKPFGGLFTISPTYTSYVAILRGVSIGKVTTPRVTIDPVTGAYTFYVTLGYKPPQTLYATSIAVTTTAVPKPTTVSVAPAAFGFNTQNQTQTFTATVKDQFGNIISPQPAVTWASNVAAVTVNASTGVATAIGTGATAVITATVTSAPSVTGTATATTPATVPTTLTINAGYAVLEAAAAAASQKIGFSVNDSYESHLNYAQNYQQTAGSAGILSVNEKFHAHWVAAVTSLSTLTTNFPEFYAEWARAQGQGSRIKIPYLIDEGIDASGGIYPGITTYVTSELTAFQMLATFAGAITSLFNPQPSAGSWSSATAYTPGQTAQQLGTSYACVVANTNQNPTTTNVYALTAYGQTAYWVPVNSPTILAWNSGTAYAAGQYATDGGDTWLCWNPNTNNAPPNTNYWIQVGSGAGGTYSPIDVYSAVNECLLGGAAQGFFNSFFGNSPQTWVPLFLAFLYAGDPNARLYEINNGHGESTSDSAQRSGVFNLLTHCAMVLPAPLNAKLGNGYEGHVVCSQMQNGTGTFDETNFIAWANSFHTNSPSITFAITEFDVTDDMLEGSGASGVTQRQQLVGLAYQRFFASVALFTVQPDHVIFWQLRCPETWLNASFPRSDGLPQWPNLLLDYNFTQAPAWTAVVSWLTAGLGAIGAITVSDAFLHQVPATLLDQWGASLSLTNLTWSSTNATFIPVTNGGQFQALAGSESATLTATYAATSLTATVTVDSSAAALAALAVSPNPVTLASGTQQLAATEVDQYGNAWAGGGGAGGVWVFGSGDSGISTNVAAIASASLTLWGKMRLKVDALRSMGTWGGAKLFQIDADGAGTHPKMRGNIGTNGSGQFALTIGGYGTGAANLGGPETPYVNLSALPAAGNYVYAHWGWNQTLERYYVAVADENGNIINDGTNSCSNTQAANYGVLNTDGGANGVVSINKASLVTSGATSIALTWDGFAIYTNAPPGIAAGTSSTCFSKPLAGDAGIGAGWYMDDATSGSITTGLPFVGGQDVTLTGCTGGLSDSNGWSAGAGPTVGWSSDNTAAATVSNTGLVTAVAPGIADIQAVVTGAPTIAGTSVVTVQTTPVASSLTVNPTAATLAQGGTVQIVPTVLDQYGNPFTTATITYASSATGVATVNADTGLVTWVATGSATITATVTSVTPNLTATTAVTATTSVYTNQPSGMTAIINTGPITTVPASGASFAGVTFSMFSPTTPSPTSGWSGNLTVVPSGQGTGWRLTYPSNITGGYSPVRFGFGGWPVQTYKTLYVYFRIRYSSNWTNNGNVGTKICEPQFINSNNSGHENHVISGSCDNPPDTDQYLQWFLQGPSGAVRSIPGNNNNNTTYASLDPNGNLAGPTRGNWHTVEMLALPQSSVTGTTATADGTASIWVDGALAATATNVTWVGPGDSQYWGYLLVDPTYGGGTASPPNVTPALYVDWDQIYFSGK